MGININDDGEPWTNSGGGPVVVIPAELASQWRGTSPPLGVKVPEGWTWGGAGGPECDYDRACDPPTRKGTPYGGFGWVPVAGTPVLVLDAEITTVFRATRYGGYIIRSSIEGTSLDPATVEGDAWFTLGPEEIELKDGRLFMFDSAFEGTSDPEQNKAHNGVGLVALGPGIYRVSFGTNLDEVDFVRLRRMG